MRDLIKVFPPVGSPSVLLHTRHLTLVEALPKIICSFVHLGHLILMNFEVVSLTFGMISPYTNSTLFARMPFLCTCAFLQTLHSNLKSIFFVGFLLVIFHLVIAGFE